MTQSAIFRLADAMTICGIGFVLWLGIGLPRVVGEGAVVASTIAALLIMAKPLAEIAINPARFKFRLEDRFGWTTTYTTLIILLLLAAYTYEWEKLNRWEFLGLIITALACFAIVLSGWNRARFFTTYQHVRIARTLLFLGYAGTGGALLAGQIQFATIALAGLALLQLLTWWLYKRSRAKVAIYPVMRISGLVFAVVIPIAMMTSLLIGHGLAIVLVASYVIGLALLIDERSAPKQQN